MINDIFIKALLKRNFPSLKHNILFCFAYGSAALPQVNNKGKMLDLIFIVKDTYEFHEQNLLIHNNHYSWLCKSFGINIINKLNNYQPSVYFNHSVDLLINEKEYIKVKYGVISLKQLILQLNTYNSFFILGRCHKPLIKANFQIFDKLNKDKYIGLILNKNKKYAFCLSLIMSKSLNEYDILHCLVSISFIGDIRFYLKGEKKSKVTDILDGAYELFIKEYKDFFIEYGFLSIDNRFVYMRNENELIQKAFNELPTGFIRAVYSNCGYKAIHFDRYLNLISNMNKSELALIFSEYIKNVNFKISLKYLFVAALTSPMFKGLSYISKKIQKGLQ